MQGEPRGFWGKLESDDKSRVVAWHPLIDHCADVAAVCERLLDPQSSVLRRRLEALAGRRLTDVDVARLCVLAALHDIGKFCVGFQNIAFRHEGRSFCGHVGEAIALIRSSQCRELAKVLPLDMFHRWDPNFRLWFASIQHHGAPRPKKAAVCQWKPSRGLRPFDEIQRLSVLLRRWFPRAFEDGVPLPDATAFNHAFGGLVMLADWLGSSTEYFPYSESPGSDRMAFARDVAPRMLKWIGLDTSHLRGRTTSFAEVTGHPTPRVAQRAVLSLPADTSPSLVFLEAETGSGKTEAAVMRFLQLRAEGMVDGMYLAVPTRAAATQIHSRLVANIQNAYGDDAPPVTLAIPGYLRVDDVVGRHLLADRQSSTTKNSERRLPPFEVLWSTDKEQHRRAKHRGWSVENPKRYFAGGVVVGTIDQALLSTLMTKHAHLRATGLLRMFLVIDEVHASDTYMTKLSEEVLRFHLGAGGHAMLMSATLGVAARHQLESLLDDGSDLPALEQAIAEPYPRVALGSDPTPVEADDTRQKNVSWKTERWHEVPGAMVDAVRSAVGDGARVLIIRNTVTGALLTQRRLEDAGVRSLSVNGFSTPHHSRYARADRRKLDQAVERALGKDAQRSEGLVVVATQTCEQSLDIDADWLLTDLCPVDVLLQRVGRLHRHVRERPSGFDKAQCVVLVGEDPLVEAISTKKHNLGEGRGSNGIGTVYADLRILENTKRLIEGRDAITIPRDNRELVERATHPSSFDWTLADERWISHRSFLEGSRQSDQLVAALSTVRRERPYGQEPFPQDRRMATRLGEHDRILELEEPFRSPFGSLVRRVSIVGHIAKRMALGEDPRVVVATDDEGSDLEVVGPEHTYRFRYDRFGLHLVEEGNDE